ncbi:undecaprenyl-phosphate glucose phosphotransferase [Mucilaginibacter segetis]|uniref:Undecaprenyl-phosphate glucose phosphotransferase n=1 Tax=Mucilaginibacter segetis TaxID=2793071 RepID=A0A934UP69_9SPHI|nr:undecaprenyl-phosphate glucose phosphotransferase [Mucilaginibacter segetis]MBK0380677.1 undecaprenyl-phosphate glucose phosphotransferase [Mucilaginibacter segetis]
MEIKHSYRLNAFRFFNEASLITLSFALACSLLQYIFHTNLHLINLWMLPILIIGWYFSSRSKKTEDLSTRGILLGLYKTANSIFIQFCLVILFFFSAHQTYNTRRFIIIYIGLLSILIPLEKIIYRRIMLFLYKKGVNKKRILIIGAGKLGIEFSNIITRNKYLGYEVIGFLDDEQKPNLNGQYLGKTDIIDEFITNNITTFDEVVIALPNKAHKKIKNIAEKVSNHAVKLRIIPAYHDFVTSQYKVGMFNGLPVITIRNEPLDDIHLRAIKRLFDVIFSLAVLIFVCSWLFPLIALAIIIDSKGPAFFVQERWGRKNMKINCYKFRSMYTTSKDVAENGKYQQAKKDDLRITPVGKFLRKSNLDEFPQFINVLLGDMSVVGPRPHPTPLNLESKEIIDRYLVRHLVKPGITGMAQVNGFRGQTDDPSLMRARVNYDIWYIENWSLFLDVKIIFLTFWKTIVGDKNAF